MQIVSVSLQKYSEHITQTSFRIRAKQGRKLFPAPLTLFLSLYSEGGTVRKGRELAVSAQLLWLTPSAQLPNQSWGGKKKIVLKAGAVSHYITIRWQIPQTKCVFSHLLEQDGLNLTSGNGLFYLKAEHEKIESFYLLSMSGFSVSHDSDGGCKTELLWKAWQTLKTQLSFQEA